MMNKDPYNKVILTDCDGVLLNWGYAFGIYMQQQGCEKRQEGWGSYSVADNFYICLLYTSPSPRDRQKARMPSSA